MRPLRKQSPLLIGDKFFVIVTGGVKGFSCTFPSAKKTGIFFNPAFLPQIKANSSSRELLISCFLFGNNRGWPKPTPIG
jgi:hypothetical protein